MKVFFAVLGIFAIVGCSIERDEKNYSYRYNHNGCDTGRQEFKSKDDYCQALQNEVLNQGCARDTRMEAYDRECGASE